MRELEEFRYYGDYTSLCEGPFETQIWVDALAETVGQTLEVLTLTCVEGSTLSVKSFEAFEVRLDNNQSGPHKALTTIMCRTCENSRLISDPSFETQKMMFPFHLMSKTTLSRPVSTNLSTQIPKISCPGSWTYLPRRLKRPIFSFEALRMKRCSCYEI